MKPAVKIMSALATLAAIAFAVGGCGDVGVGVGVSASNYTPVYGDYGYVGPWENPALDYGGGYLAAPPYHRFDGDHRDDHRGPEPAHVAPAARPEPERNRPAEHRPTAPQPAPRPIPSIPNHPRPTQSPPRGNNSRDDEHKRE